MAGPCAAIFSGYLKIEKESLYTFFVVSDDGAKLYLDGELVVDNDGIHGMSENWGQLDLKPGLHHLWLSYFNAGGAMGLNLFQKMRGESREPFAASSLFHAPAASQAHTLPAKAGSTGAHSQPASTARLLRLDTSRGGDWKRDLGKSGHVLFNQQGPGKHAQRLPDFIHRCDSTGEHHVYPQGEDPRGLEDPGAGKSRLCAVEYSATEVVVHIGARNRTRHQLSLYCLDVDKLGRRQRVTLQAGERILHEQDLDDLSAPSRPWSW